MEGHDDAGARLDALGRTGGRRRALPVDSGGTATQRALQLRTAGLARPDAQQAGRDVLGALAAPSMDTVADQTADQLTEVDSPADQPPSAADAEPPHLAPRASRLAPPLGFSTCVEFAPKRLVRRVLGAITLLVAVGAGGAGYLAYLEPNTFSVGVAATMGVLLLVTWAIRVGTPLTRLTVKGGQLDIRQGGLFLKFDLSSQFTAIDVRGRPGRRGWQVTFGRGTERPFVVDSSVVDPVEFMRVLRSYRPE